MHKLIPHITTVAVALALVACGSGDDDAAPSESDAAAKPVEVNPLPDTPETTLVAGRYEAKVFTPGLTLEIPKNDSTWQTLPPGESKRHFGLTVLATGLEGLNTLGFHRMEAVADPKRGARTRADSIEAPADFVDWLSKHRHLDAGEPEDIEIGGQSGRAIDVTVKSVPKRIPDECTEGGFDCLPLFFDQDEPIVYNVGAKLRFLSLDVGDEPVVVELFSMPGEQFDRVAALLEPVLNSVSFD